MIRAWLMLAIAIAVEVAATSSLPRTHGMRNPVWTLYVAAGYGISIWLLALVVRTLPVSTTYAIWSGLGTATVAVIGALWLGEAWDWVKVLGLVLIIGGVVLVNLRVSH